MTGTTERGFKDEVVQLRADSVDPDLDICVDRRGRGTFAVEGLGVTNRCLAVSGPVQDPGCRAVDRASCNRSSRQNPTP